MEEPQQPVMFYVDLHLDNGRNHVLAYRKGDSIEDVAYQFCRDNELNITYYDKIAGFLKSKLSEVKSSFERSGVKRININDDVLRYFGMDHNPSTDRRLVEDLCHNLDESIEERIGRIPSRGPPVPDKPPSKPQLSPSSSRKKLQGMLSKLANGSSSQKKGNHQRPFEGNASSTRKSNRAYSSVNEKCYASESYSSKDRNTVSVKLELMKGDHKHSMSQTQPRRPKKVQPSSSKSKQRSHCKSVCSPTEEHLSNNYNSEVVKALASPSSKVPNEIPRFEQLYNLSKILEDRSAARMRLANLQYSFKPHLNEYQSLSVQKSFNERLEQDLQGRQERQKELRVEVDKESNRKRSIPQTGRPPICRTKQQGTTVHQNLYNLAAKKALSRQKKQEDIEKKRKDRSDTPKSIKKSSEIVEKLVTEKIAELFDLLDHDHDGIISSARVCINLLNKERLAIIAPLLTEMEDKKATLDFSAFDRALRRLLAIIDIEAKRILLNIDFSRQKKLEAQQTTSFSFKPVIDTNTDKILRNAQTRKQSGSNSEERYRVSF